MKNIVRAHTRNINPSRLPTAFTSSGCQEAAIHQNSSKSITKMLIAVHFITRKHITGYEKHSPSAYAEHKPTAFTPSGCQEPAMHQNSSSTHLKMLITAYFTSRKHLTGYEDNTHRGIRGTSKHTFTHHVYPSRHPSTFTT